MIRLEEQLKQYRPWNEQEKEDKKELLRVLTQPGIFLR